MISAYYYDGLSAQAHPIEIELHAGQIRILGLVNEVHFKFSSISLQEPFSNAPAILEFSDGTHCEVFDPEQKKNLQSALGYQPSRVERWQTKSHNALLALIFMIAILLIGYFWGLPKLADILADHAPVEMEISMGKQLMPILDRTLFKESQVSKQRIQQIEAILARIEPTHPRLPIHVIVRNSERLGPNAVALPGGTIVVTDQLVMLIAGLYQDFEGGVEKEMAAVIAHEIGHIENKDALRGLFHDSILTAASASLIGDFSVVASALPTMMIHSEFSREIEAQADEYAFNLLQVNHISPSHLADALEELQQAHKHSIQAELPRWMRVATDFNATHPPTAERIAKARARTIPEE